MSDGDFFFSSPKLRQRPFWPSRPQTYTRSQASEGSRPRAAAIQPLHVSSRTHLPPPSLLHLQRDSKELTPTIHGHLAKASVLRAVATATASHTHMCGIGGQGSWVVLAGLNGALCVIIQTSSNPKLWKVMQKKKKRDALSAAKSPETRRLHKRRWYLWSNHALPPVSLQH